MAAPKAIGFEALVRYTREVYAREQPSLYRKAERVGLGRALDEGPSVLYRFIEDELQGGPVREPYLQHLVKGLAIWLPSSVYTRAPVLLPHVKRDNHCRKVLCDHPAHVKRSKGRVGEQRDLWSTPTLEGYLRDDNSLIKMLPGSSSVCAAAPGLEGHRIGKGFVACHIWPMSEASDPWLNSFVPNLVWLPKPLDLMSDRPEHLVRQLLMAESIRRFRSHDTAAPGEAKRLWASTTKDKARTSPGEALGGELVPSTHWFRSRLKKIITMAELLGAVAQGGPGSRRSGHSHYDAHLGDLEPEHVRPLARRLANYTSQLETGSWPRDLPKVGMA